MRFNSWGFYPTLRGEEADRPLIVDIKVFLFLSDEDLAKELISVRVQTTHP